MANVQTNEGENYNRISNIVKSLIMCDTKHKQRIHMIILENTIITFRNSKTGVENILDGTKLYVTNNFK